MESPLVQAVPHAVTVALPKSIQERSSRRRLATCQIERYVHCAVEKTVMCPHIPIRRAGGNLNARPVQKFEGGIDAWVYQNLATPFKSVGSRPHARRTVSAIQIDTARQV